MCPFVKPDFSEVTGGYAPLTVGSHPCVILSSEIKTAKESLNEYVSWKLQTLDDKRTVYYNTPLHGKAAGMFKHLVHCAGRPEYEGGPFDTSLLNNKIISCNLTIEEVTNSWGDKRQVYKVKEVHRAEHQRLPIGDNEDIPF